MVPLPPASTRPSSAVWKNTPASSITRRIRATYPAAEEFLVEAGAEVSYAAAARLLARAGGTRVSAKTVMAAVHAAGERCAEEDARAARDLFDRGIKPGGRTVAEQVCVEADGTWAALQGAAPGEPSKVEIKAVAAYSGKVERGRKVAREHCVRHGCACAPGEFWPEAVAAIGSEFDLSALERVHLGTDGRTIGGNQQEPALHANSAT